MTLKNCLRKYTAKWNWFERLWLKIEWLKTNYYAKKYNDYDYSLILWKKYEGALPNLKSPTTFNEKLWYLKLSNRDPLLTKCSDKHEVRKYIEQCGYGNCLKKEYAFFHSADEIEFEKLPSPSYLKCNHASGMNLIFRKEDKNDLKHIRWKFNYLLKQNPYYLSREWNYKDIKPGIVCEELLSMPNGEDIPEIQFFCFDGVPKFIMYNLGLADESGRHKKAIRWVFDMDWNIIPVKTSMPTNDNAPEKPIIYDQLVKMAEDLSKPFPHVRVDLFCMGDRAIFNELTFYSGGGCVKLEPECWQKAYGDFIDCSAYKIAPDAYEKHTL